MLPRLEAEEALRDAQIALLPHLSDDKRQTVIERWETLARDDSAARFDARGRRRLDTAEELNAFLAQFGAV